MDDTFHKVQIQLRKMVPPRTPITPETELYRDLGLYGDGSAPGWLDAKAAIKRLADYCKANGITLVIASLPELHDVKNYRFDLVTQLVKEAAAENGAIFVDLLPSVRGEPSEALWVTPPDPHPNALANGLIAAGLFATLRGLPQPGVQ